MIKKVVYASIAGLSMLLIVLPALAKPEPVSPDLPEQAGIYQAPGRPDLKLRVFVHQPKPVKPAKPGVVSPDEICALADPDSSAVVAGAGWKLPATWTYYLNSASAPASVGVANLPTIANNAFGQWRQAIGDVVAIEYAGETTVKKAQLDGQNIIAWGRANATALAVSYIWYDNQGYAVEIDTIMNQKFVWYWSDPSVWPADDGCAYEGVYDAQNILTHELGHTFGLDDHYTVDYQDNTMFGYGAKAETKKDTLTAGDIAGLQALY